MYSTRTKKICIFDCIRFVLGLLDTLARFKDKCDLAATSTQTQRIATTVGIPTKLRAARKSTLSP